MWTELVVRLVLSCGDATNVGAHSTVHQTTEVARIAVHVRGAACLVHTRVLRLVVVEAGRLGLGPRGLRTVGADLTSDGFFSHLLLLGNGRDDTVDELLEGDLAFALGLDLGEDHVDVDSGEILGDEARFLAHLAEVGVIHFAGGGAAEGGEGFEDLLEVGHGC